MFFGSCAGFAQSLAYTLSSSIQFTADFEALTYVNASNSQLSHMSTLYARSSWLLSAWDVGYAVEFLFLSVVKLLVLDRTLDLACECMSFPQREFVTLCDLTLLRSLDA